VHIDVTYTETSMCQRFVNFEVLPSNARAALNLIEEYAGSFYRESDGVIYHKVSQVQTDEELAFTLCLIFSPDRSQRVQQMLAS